MWHMKDTEHIDIFENITFQIFGIFLASHEVEGKLGFLEHLLWAKETFPPSMI